MKVKFLIAALFFSLVAAAQPSNYIKFNTRGRWIAGMFDSTLHVPRFNGSPSLRTGGSSMDGAIAIDTTNNIMYFYSGGAWKRANLDTSAYAVTSVYRKTASDSVFYVKGGVHTFAFKDSTGGGTPTLQQVLTAGSTLTGGNSIIGDDDLILQDFVSLDFSAIDITLTSNTGSGGQPKSKVNISDTLMLNPYLSNLKIDSLNYTLSTTGKKILIRDTATGLVQNIDPSLLVASSYTFTNGLTDSSGTVKLGGTITEKTTYDVSGGDSVVFKGLDTTVRNSNVVEAGGYPAIATGGADLGNSFTSFAGINNAYYSRIRQNGNITHIRMYFASKPASLTSFRITVWRASSGTSWDRVGSEEIISLITGGTTNYIALPNAITAQEGDYVGYEWDASSNPGDFLKYSLLASGLYFTTGTPSTTGYNWSAQSSYGLFIPVKVYMQAPHAVFIGNSIMEGYSLNYSFLESSGTFATSVSIPYKVSALMNWTFQNMAKAGNFTSDILGRIKTDVTDLYPNYAIVDGGVNDIVIVSNILTTDIVANYKKIFDSLSVHNIKTIWLNVFPCTNASNAQNKRIDSLNVRMDSLAALYPLVTVVDVRSSIGLFRTGGDAGNYWDIQPAYDLDGTHLNAAGNQVVANAIAQAISGITGNQGDLLNVSVNGVSSSFLKGSGDRFVVADANGKIKPVIDPSQYLNIDNTLFVQNQFSAKQTARAWIDTINVGALKVGNHVLNVYGKTRTNSLLISPANTGGFSRLSFGGDDASINNRIAFLESADGTNYYGIGMSNPGSGIYGIALYGGTGGSAPSETNHSMFIRTTGDVGIGTGSAAPGAKLDVRGDIKATTASGYATNINGSLSGNNFATISYVDSTRSLESTYTPSLTNTTNIAASTAYTTHYQRVGDVVHVWGEVQIDATSALTISEMGLSLPVASSITDSRELAGTGAFEDNTIVQIKGDGTNDRAMLRFIPQTNTANTYSFHFSYKYVAP